MSKTQIFNNLTSAERSGAQCEVEAHCGGRRASGKRSQIISELTRSHVSDMLCVMCHCRDVPWRISTFFTDARGASLQCHQFSYKCVIFAADFSPTARLCPPPTSPTPTTTTSSFRAWPPSRSRCGSAPQNLQTPPVLHRHVCVDFIYFIQIKLFILDNSF